MEKLRLRALNQGYPVCRGEERFKPRLVWCPKPSSLLQAHCLLGLKAISFLSNPSEPLGYGGVLPQRSLFLMVPGRGLRELKPGAFHHLSWEHGKWEFFFLANSVAESYNVSALENDRKKWLPAGAGRCGLFPPYREGVFAPEQQLPLPCPWMGPQEGLCAGSGFCPLPVWGVVSFGTHHLKFKRASCFVTLDLGAPRIRVRK